MYTTEVLARATARLAGLRADHESQANARQAELEAIARLFQED